MTCRNHAVPQKCPYGNRNHGLVWIVIQLTVWRQTSYCIETDHKICSFVYIAQLWCNLHAPKQIPAFKNEHSPTQLSQPSRRPPSPPPPMYRLTASIYASSCKCSHLPSVVVSRNHTQVHKDTITWKHDKWPRSVVCRVLTVSLIHMNSCVNRIHTA